MGSSILLDHLSTWNEVCDALAFSSVDAFERGCDCEAVCELKPDARGGISAMAEELAWLELASKVQEPRWN